MKQIWTPVLALLLLFPSSSVTQSTHDVILLHDSTIVRGTVTEVAPNRTTYITTIAGRHRICLWSEIRKRLMVPASLPDSLLTLDQVLFLPPYGGGENDEDILILRNETFTRGVLLLSPPEGPIRFWTSSDRYLSIPRDQVIESVRLKPGTSNSTIDLYYIHPTAEVLADNFRILSIEGGFGGPVGGFAKPADALLVRAGGGFAAGIHAGIRIIPNLRWAASIFYAWQNLEFSTLLADLWAVGDLPPQQLLWALTGVEYRREGTLPFKFYGFVQVGMVNARLGEFTFQTKVARAPAGTGIQTGSRGSGFAYSIGVGLARGAFSATARYLGGTVHQEYQVTIESPGYPTRRGAFSGDQAIGVVLLTVGFSPF